jgi:enediyne polyketide synthase
LCATERSRDGDTHVYDIAVRASSGEVVERWDGLRLRAVRRRDGRGPWVAALLGPYVERALEDLLGARVAVVVEPDRTDGPTGRDRTALAVSRALGTPTPVRYRPDGRPEIDGGLAVSAAHGAGLTLATVGPGPLGCDVETVAGRDAASWTALLGTHADLADLIAAELGESADRAATRVWTALECLQKIGQPAHAPLTLTGVRHEGWLVLASGTRRVATLVTTLRDRPDPVVLAVLTDGRS